MSINHFMESEKLIEELQAENARLLSENTGLKEENKYFIELLKTEDVRRGAESMLRFVVAKQGYGNSKLLPTWERETLEEWESQNAK